MSDFHSGVQKYRVQFTNPQSSDDQTSIIELREHEIYAPKDLELRIQCIGQKVIVFQNTVDIPHQDTIHSIIILEKDTNIDAEIQQLRKTTLVIYSSDFVHRFVVMTGYQKVALNLPQGALIFDLKNDNNITFDCQKNQGNTCPNFSYTISKIDNTNPPMVKITVKNLDPMNGTGIELGHDFRSCMDEIKLCSKLTSLSLGKEYRYSEKNVNGHDVKGTKFVVTKILTNEKIKEILNNSNDLSLKVFFHHH